MKQILIIKSLIRDKFRLISTICCIVLTTGCCKIFYSGNLFTRANQNVLFSKNYQPPIKNLNIQGYFYRDEIDNLRWERVLVFYKNGIAIDYKIEKSHENIKREQLKDLRPLIGGIYTHFIYTIRNDTLILDDYLNTCYYCMLRSRFYVIEDNNTLHYVKYASYDEKGGSTVINENEILHFVPVDTMPDIPELKLKEEKWMWENEDEWKAYKRELKARKDSIKRARKLNSKLMKR